MCVSKQTYCSFSYVPTIYAPFALVIVIRAGGNWARRSIFLAKRVMSLDGVALELNNLLPDLGAITTTGNADVPLG